MDKVVHGALDVRRRHLSVTHGDARIREGVGEKRFDLAKGPDVIMHEEDLAAARQFALDARVQ